MRPCLAFTIHPLPLLPLLPRPSRFLFLLLLLPRRSPIGAAAGASRFLQRLEKRKKKMQRLRDCNRNGAEGGDRKAVLRQKKLKAKTLKWRSSNKDMNSKAEAGGSGGVYDDAVLCSLTSASLNSLVNRKRVRNLGKVAQQCDAIDPPVPRRLRSAINNKRVRHVKKKRHLSSISAQISFVDQQTRFDEASLLTEEEEVADALLSLSKVSSTCEFVLDKVISESKNLNVSSTSYSEGAMKEGDKITILPNPDELSNQAACIAGRTSNVPHVNSVPGATGEPSNINRPLLENAQIRDISLGVVANLPSPCEESSHNSEQKELKVQLDDSKNYPAPKPKAPLCLVNSNKSDNLMPENVKDKNDSAQDIMHRVQTPLPCTPDGYLIKPSSSELAVQANTVSEFSKVTASGNLDKFSSPGRHFFLRRHGSEALPTKTWKLPQDNNGVPTKTWKRSLTHVYVSHLIQMHLNKENAASQCQVLKPEERSHTRASRSPDVSTSLKSNPQEEARYAVHLDVRLPVQQAPGIRSMSAAAGRQKMVSTSDFLNLPTSTALQRAQHVHQYLRPQITPRGPMAYPFPHGRASLAPASATLEQMRQYTCTPGYAPRPVLLAANPSAVMKLQQLPPAQQQQQMWLFHVAQYQPRPDVSPPGAAAWHNVPSLRPTSMVPAPAVPPQMELLCAPYRGGSRQQQQLRLMM